MTRSQPKLHRYRARLPFWAKDGAPVWYSPSTGARFAAVIDGNPWFAHGTAAWFARLREVETAAGRVLVASEMVASLKPRLEAPRE